MEKLKKNYSQWKYFLSISFVSIILIGGLLGIFQSQNVPQLIPQDQIISTGALSLPVNTTFRFTLNIDKGIVSNYLSYTGSLKVLAQISLPLQRNASQVPGYELELSFVNPINASNNNNSPGSNPDSLSALGCPTRIIHVLITQKGRVVGIPFYGVQCPNLNNSIPIFNYSYFVFTTNTMIPPLQNQTTPSYFDLLYNISTRNYWDDWENVLVNNTHTTVWDLKNYMYLWDSTAASMTYLNLTSLGIGNTFTGSGTQIGAQDPWSPLFLYTTGNDIKTAFTNYFTFLARQVFTIWDSTFYYFPFFQASVTERTTYFHCGLASTSTFQNSSSDLILTFPNVTLSLNNVIFAQQFTINAKYSWNTGYPHTVSESDYGTSRYLYTSNYQFSA